MRIYAHCADRLVVMYVGQIVETEDIKSISKEAKHPYTEMLIESVPSLEKKELLKPTLGKPPDLGELPTGCRFYPRRSYVSGICVQKEPKLIEMKNGQRALVTFMKISLAR